MVSGQCRAGSLLGRGARLGPPVGPSSASAGSSSLGPGAHPSGNPIGWAAQPCNQALLGQKSQPPAGLARNLSRPGGLSFLMSPLRPALCQLPGRQGTSPSPWPALSTRTQS